MGYGDYAYEAHEAIVQNRADASTKRCFAKQVATR